MTGFARIKKTVPEGEIVVGLKSVNHRALDLHFHLPQELDVFESSLRAVIKNRVARGHLQIHVGFTPAGETAKGTLNRALMAAYLSAFQQAQSEFQIQSKPDLNQILRIPGMFQGETTPEIQPELEKALIAALEEALETLNRFREREGATVAAEMRQRCGIIAEQVGEMEKIRSRATAAFLKRLKERLRDLLRGAGIEPQRLAQEAALLADRSDVSEELIRLKTHAGQVDALLQTEGEVGKKLDFLLQEMNRETNTILSKTNGIGEIGLKITEIAIAIKSDIEKVREQSLNLE